MSATDRMRGRGRHREHATIRGSVPRATALALAAMLILSVPALADPDAAGAEPPAPRGAARFPELDWLIGEWQGYGTFPGRTTYIHKSFDYEIGGMFLMERTLDMFPPPEPSTEFEIHQDTGVYYRTADGLGATTFFVEAYVTTATVTVGSDGSIVVESVAIENAPQGMRSRITYTPRDADTFEGRFELAMPGKEYGLLETLEMRRIR
ncbi:MAG: hypothetical protein PVF43_11035 [Candidatus Eiseniibacteriota bacterium]|jgi:hypothetical protein